MENGVESSEEGIQEKYAQFFHSHEFKKMADTRKETGVLAVVPMEKLRYEQFYLIEQGDERGSEALKQLMYATGTDFESGRFITGLRGRQWYLMGCCEKRALERLERLIQGTGVNVSEQDSQEMYKRYVKKENYTGAGISLIQELARIVGNRPIFPVEFIQEVYREKMLDWTIEGLREFHQFTGIAPNLEESVIQEIHRIALEKGLVANAKFIKETTKIAPNLETNNVQSGLQNWAKRYREEEEDRIGSDERRIQRIQNLIQSLKEIIEFIGIERLQGGLQACYAFCTKRGLISEIELLMRETQIPPELEDSVVQEGYLYMVENGIPEYLEKLYVLTKAVPTREVIEESFKLIHYLERITYDNETMESGRGHMIPCEWANKVEELGYDNERIIGCKEILERIGGVKYSESGFTDEDQIKLRYKSLPCRELKEPPEGAHKQLFELYCLFHRIELSGFASTDSPEELTRQINELELDETAFYSDGERQFLQSFVMALDTHTGYGRFSFNVPFSIRTRSILRKIKKILDQKTE